jgi:hypothetical protein
MFRPNRPSSGVQVVVMIETAAHCNAFLLLIRSKCISKAERHYSEQQIPSSQKPVHLMMAGLAETCSDNKEKKMR